MKSLKIFITLFIFLLAGKINAQRTIFTNEGLRKARFVTEHKFDARIGVGTFSGTYINFVPKLTSDFHTIGAYSAEFNFYPFSWMSIGLGFNYEYFFLRYEGPNLDKGYNSLQNTGFYPVVRFGRRIGSSVFLSSGISYGADIRLYSGGKESARNWELIPFSVTFGRRFFGSIELGIGTLYNGVRAQFGVRF